jgi:hypothetical protein
MEFCRKSLVADNGKLEMRVAIATISLHVMQYFYSGGFFGHWVLSEREIRSRTAEPHVAYAPQ